MGRALGNASRRVATFSLCVVFSAATDVKEVEARHISEVRHLASLTTGKRLSAMMTPKPAGALRRLNERLAQLHGSDDVDAEWQAEVDKATGRLYYVK